MSEWIPDEIYRGFLKRMPIVCVDIAIIHNGKILMVRREDEPCKGQWWLPGGRIYKGEMLRNAAVRKANEEVGLKCYVGPILHTAETIFDEGPGNIPVHSVNVCFLMFPTADSSQLVKLDEHHSKFQWVDSIPDGLHPYVVDCLEKSGVFEVKAQPALKRAG